MANPTFSIHVTIQNRLFSQSKMFRFSSLSTIRKIMASKCKIQIPHFSQKCCGSCIHRDSEFFNLLYVPSEIPRKSAFWFENTKKRVRGGCSKFCPPDYRYSKKAIKYILLNSISGQPLLSHDWHFVPTKTNQVKKALKLCQFKYFVCVCDNSCWNKLYVSLCSRVG